MRTLLATALVGAAACSGTIGAPPGGGSGTPDAKNGGPGTPDSRSNPATPDAPAGVGEPAALAGITLAHNQARMKVGVPPLVWDSALAASAQAYVQQCIDADGNGLVDHNPNRSNGFTFYVGENIYASSGTATGPDAVALWVSEAQYYDYATNTCAAGQVCGHYTQVVWSTSQKLGCGIYDCAGLTYPSTIVCDYGPGGNDGGRPY